MYPDHGADQQTLVRNGKLAVRAARDAAERVAVYDPAHGESEELKVRYEARLRRALEEGALGIAFEPQLDLAPAGSPGSSACSAGRTGAGRGAGGAGGGGGRNRGPVREVTWWLFNNALRQCAEFARGGLHASGRAEGDARAACCSRISRSSWTGRSAPGACRRSGW